MVSRHAGDQNSVPSSEWVELGRAYNTGGVRTMSTHRPAVVAAAAAAAVVATHVATAQTSTDALPLENAPPVCQTTIKLMKAATKGWRRATHWLLHGGVRQIAHTMLLIAERLHRMNNSDVGSDGVSIGDGFNNDGGDGVDDGGGSESCCSYSAFPC